MLELSDRRKNSNYICLVWLGKANTYWGKSEAVWPGVKSNIISLLGLPSKVAVLLSSPVVWGDQQILVLHYIQSRPDCLTLCLPY